MLIERIDTPYPYLKHHGFIDAEQVDSHLIDSVIAHKQADIGKKNDCTITSIATLFEYALKDDIEFQNIYNTVINNIRPKVIYGGNLYGTVPLFIKNIIEKTLKHYKNNNLLNDYKKVEQRYLKNIGFNFNKIKRLLDNGYPIILNISGNKKDYYNNHTILIIGYSVYEDKYGDTLILLKVLDNWSTRIKYLDYSAIPFFTTINYIS